MKEKKGFTLVELLAVIAILAVILIIAVPTILGVIEDAKERSFRLSVLNVFRTIELEYARTGKTSGNIADLAINNNPFKTGSWEFNEETKKVSIKKVCNGSYKIGVLNNEQGENFEVEKDNGDCFFDEFADWEDPTGGKCTFTGELVPGATFEDGTYTYTYKKRRNWINIENMDEDGWSVALTAKNSKDPITTSPLCTVVSKKPVVSTSFMFMWSMTPSVDLSDFDTSNITDMSGMFYTIQRTIENIKFGNRFDTSKVINMSRMFENTKIKELDLSTLDTRNVTNMSGFFNNISFTEKIILGDNFNTSKVTDMSSMFKNNFSVADFDFSRIDTSNVTNVSYMFSGFRLPELDLSIFDFSKVTDMRGFFSELFNVKINLGDDFNTSKITDMSYMFYRFGVEDFDFSRIDTSNVTNATNMFSDFRLPELDLSVFDFSKVTNMSGFFSYLSDVKINLGDNFNTSKVTDMSSMFYGFQIADFDFSRIDTSNVTNMESMFRDFGLSELNLSSFDTSNVTDMNWMFHSATNLESLKLGNNFDTSNVTSMQAMFTNLSWLTSLDLGDKFDTSKVTNMSYMFDNMQELVSLDLGNNFDTSNVKYMENMFFRMSSLTNLSLGNKFDTSNATSMSSMFDGMSSITNLNLGNKFDTSNVEYMSYMFSDMNNLETLDIHTAIFNTEKLINYSSMFSGVKTGLTIKAKDEAAKTFLQSRINDAGITATITIP